MSWSERGLCSQHKEIDWLLDEERGAISARANLAAARAVCQQCPVTAQCLSEAMGNWNTVGIWAGTIDADRRRLRAKRTRFGMTQKNIILEGVRSRLEAQEGWCELRQLERLSPAEVDLLVKMERGWGPIDPQFPHPQADQQFPQTYPLYQDGNSQGYAPGTPQAMRGGVAFMANDTDEIRLAS